MQKTQNFKVLATEPTPNAAAYKFVVSNPVIKVGSKAFNNVEEAKGDLFAEAMFSLGVVDFLFIQDRFVSVTLTSAEEWEEMIDLIIPTIEEYLVAYESDEEKEARESSILDEIDVEKFMEYSDDVKAQIIDAYMDEGVRPSLAYDGGGVIVEDVDGNVVHIRYQGACGSCNKSQGSTLSAIENLLKSNIHPDLKVSVGGFQSSY